MYKYTNGRRSRVRYWRSIHIHKASTVCYILDYTLKVARFLKAKKERRVNAFHYVFAEENTLPLQHPATRTPTGLPLSGLRRKDK